MTTTVDLLTATGTRLAAVELPPIASVHVTTATSAPQVTVRLTCHDPAAIDACTTIPPGALRRATTLREVTA